MSDFSVRSDSVDVEQIMRQIRARIRDKRGVDYTEQQIQELASAKLERFLDPKGVRSDLLEHYRRHRGEGVPLTYAFEDTTLFESDKAIVRFVRRMLQPVLKLFFNYSILAQTLHTQAAANRHLLQSEDLYFELVHNLVLELTRSSIELKSLKMRVEALQSRLEFTERRSRALEGVVQYRPEALKGAPRSDAPAAAGPSADGTEPQGGVDPLTGGESVRTRRRRRRRGRRGQSVPGSPDQPPGSPGGAPEADLEGDEGDEEPGAVRGAGAVPDAGAVADAGPVVGERSVPDPGPIDNAGSDPNPGREPDGQ